MRDLWNSLNKKIRRGSERLFQHRFRTEHLSKRKNNDDIDQLLERQRQPLISKEHDSIFTLIPDQEPIELIAYYEEFRNYYLKCELNTKKWFVHNIHKDWVIFDCGANIGYFTILFARLATHGHVYAFEPTNTYEMLLKNLTYHQVKNVTPLNIALGKYSGKREDAIFRIWGNKPERKVFSFITLDDFIKKQQLKRVDCIKIDVDSFDFDVLQGAEKTLLQYNPFVVVELNHALNERNQSNMQALEWLADLKYETCLNLDYDNFIMKKGEKFDAVNVQKSYITIVFARPASFEN